MLSGPVEYERSNLQGTSAPLSLFAFAACLKWVPAPECLSCRESVQLLLKKTFFGAYSVIIYGATIPLKLYNGKWCDQLQYAV
jgi:hypothetical protein